MSDYSAQTLHRTHQSSVVVVCSISAVLTALGATSAVQWAAVHAMQCVRNVRLDCSNLEDRHLRGVPQMYLVLLSDPSPICSREVFCFVLLFICLGPPCRLPKVGGLTHRLDAVLC